jgi:hypothetical protein
MRKSQTAINEWIRAQQVRLGIETSTIGGSVPTVTVYPGERTMERLAHFGADRLIANNPAYDAMCEQTDAMLAEIIEGVRKKLTPLPRNRRSATRILTND